VTFDNSVLTAKSLPLDVRRTSADGGKGGRGQRIRKKKEQPIPAQDTLKTQGKRSHQLKRGQAETNKLESRSQEKQILQITGHSGAAEEGWADITFNTPLSQY